MQQIEMVVLYGLVSAKGRKITRQTVIISLFSLLFLASQFGFQIGLSASVSQVIYSQPGWSSPFLGRGNSVGPPALSGVIMFSVKHNQSPPSLPLYKPRGPPINTGWLGDLSLLAGRRAELSRAGQQTADCILMQPRGEACW